MKWLLALVAATLLRGCASAGIGGFDYAPQYDFAEFWGNEDDVRPESGRNRPGHGL
jgi:hypothetical protein